MNALTYKPCPPHDPMLQRFLARDPLRHLYLLGDTQPPFSRYSRFWLATDGDDARACVLCFQDGARAALLAAGDPQATTELFARIETPRQVVYLLEETHLDTLLPSFNVERAMPFKRMGYDGSSPRHASGISWRRLTHADVDLAEKLARDVSEVAFTRRQFLNNPFVGAFDEQNRVIAMAGTHVCSQRLGIAAIGSVGVHPHHRRQGLGQTVMQAIVSELHPRFAVIGLNVAADNRAARRLYRRLGFHDAFSFLVGTATQR